MSFNEILVAAGGFGFYQKCLSFGFLAFSPIMIAITYWTQVFILFIPPHRCKIFDNDTDWIPNLNESNGLKSDRCNQTQNGNETPCTHGMVYDFSLDFPTYASENDLVCESAWRIYFIHTAYWIGIIFGTFFYGIISDKFGRRRAFQFAVMTVLAADVTTLFCKKYIFFVVARFLSATGQGSIPTIIFLLVTEHTIPSKRRFNIGVWSITYAFASFAFVWLAYLVRDWRYILFIACISPSIAVIATYFVPESPSWLMTKGRTDEAVENIQRMARINGKSISKDFIIQRLQSIDKKENCEEKNGKVQLKIISCDVEKNDSQKEKYETTCSETFLAVLKSPNLRKRILCLAFIWMVVCSCYNGNNLEFHYLPFNMYITYSVGALIEIPGILFIVIVLDKIGRRWTNFILFIIGGVFGILSANVTTKSIMLILVMVMRSCYGAAYDVTLSTSTELIPTVIRGRAVSFIRTCGGMGGALAPLVVSFAQKDALLPLTCFGIAALSAGSLMLILPETAHEQLPHTIDESENFGKSQSFWFCPFLKNERRKETEEFRKNLHLEVLGNPALEKY